MLKTFKEVREVHEVYPDYIPEFLQDIINDWYDYRKICNEDEEIFIKFFNRVLARDYTRYVQLLRIEAGKGLSEIKSGYDWLVTRYLENEVITNATKSGESESTQTGSKTTGETVTPRDSETITDNGTDTYGKTHTLQHGHKIENEAGQTHTTTYGRINTTSTETEGTTATANNANTTETAKITPASVIGNYTDGTESDIHMPSSGVEVDAEIGHNNTWNSELNAPTSIGKNVQNSIQKIGSVNDTDTRSEDSGSDATRGSGKDTITNSGSDVGTDGGHDSHSNTRIITKTGTITTEGTEADSATTSAENSETSESVMHNIYTGREAEPAEVLEHAKLYIQTTSAWEWFQRRLEPCFYGIYEI